LVLYNANKEALMKLYKFKFFFNSHKKLLTVIAIIVPLITVGAVFVTPPVISAIQHNMAVNRFHNMSRETMLEDFDYLMEALEDSWPFFNLSVSANDVDVRGLADNMRVLIMDHDVEIDGPHGFLDLLREHFIWPIDQLGHLRAIWQYRDFFDSLYGSVREFEWGVQHGFEFIFDSSGMNLEFLTRPEVAMFYQTLRDAGGSDLIPEGAGTQTGHTSVLEVDILEEGSIAYLNINRMIHMWWDPRGAGARMGRYEAVLYNFYNNIKGFDHLIIDLRGNPGGMSLHFDVFVAGPLLAESITFPGYVFFKGGQYSSDVMENFDPRAFGLNMQLERMAAEFVEPLPYMDRNIDFEHAFTSEYKIYAGHYYSEWFASMGDEVAFDGKIWVLTDERTASAAEAAAAIFKYTNIATIVGEETRGIMGTMYDATSALISLPNTGIILRFDVAYFTNPYGRAL